MPHSPASGARSVYQAWWARKKLPSPRCTRRTGAAGRPCPATRDSVPAVVWVCAHSLNTSRGRPVDQVERRLGGLVLVQPVLGHQPGEPAGVDPAGHVVAGRDRAEGAGVVDEPGGPREARGLGDGGAEPPDRLGGVQEPPRHPDIERRVEAGQRGELAREHRLVEREHHQVEVRVGAVALQQRAQRVGELGPDGDVVAGVRPERRGRRPMVAAAHARVQGHHQPVVAGHAGHLQQQVPAQRRRLRLGRLAGQRGPVDPVRLGRLQRVGADVDVAVVGRDGAVGDEVPAPRLQRRARSRRSPRCRGRPPRQGRRPPPANRAGPARGSGPAGTSG